LNSYVRAINAPFFFQSGVPASAALIKGGVNFGMDRK